MSDNFIIGIFILGAAIGIIGSTVSYQFNIVMPLEHHLYESNCIKVKNNWICPNKEGKYILEGHEFNRSLTADEAKH